MRRATSGRRRGRCVRSKKPCGQGELSTTPSNQPRYDDQRADEAGAGRRPSSALPLIIGVRLPPTACRSAIRR